VARRSPTTLQGYVLHGWDFSESSLVLDVFSREAGRLAVLAKGAKRPYSHLRAVLLPFARITLTLAAQKEGSDAEVRTLRGADWAPNATLLPNAALFSGFYLNELLQKLLPRDDPHPGLWDAYAATLQSLAGPEGPAAEAALRAFELVLLRDTGVLPALGHVTSTQAPVEPGRAYALRGEAGLVAERGDEPGLPGASCLALAEALAAGGASELGAVQRACLGALPALKAQLRALLHYHLGRPSLRTREVMLEVNRLLDEPARRP
jgi:DNA repair protein RecO (recombination protein O)